MACMRFVNGMLARTGQVGTLKRRLVPLLFGIKIEVSTQ